MKLMTAPLLLRMSDQQLQRELSRWDNEGGAEARGTDLVMMSGDTDPRALPLKNAELVQLQVRVIALENLLIALLAGASDEQLALAREMAGYITPRPGFTHHRLTIHAAGQMIHLVERAGRLG